MDINLELAVVNTSKCKGSGVPHIPVSRRLLSAPLVMSFGVAHDVALRQAHVEVHGDVPATCLQVSTAYVHREPAMICLY